MGYVFVILKIPSNAGHSLSCYVWLNGSTNVKRALKILRRLIILTTWLLQSHCSIILKQKFERKKTKFTKTVLPEFLQRKFLSKDRKDPTVPQFLICWKKSKLNYQLRYSIVLKTNFFAILLTFQAKQRWFLNWIENNPYSTVGSRCYVRLDILRQFKTD